MAVAFQSAYWRNLWVGVVLGYVLDVFVVWVVLTLIKAPVDHIIFALLVPVAVYVAQWVLSLYELARRVALYFLFAEKRNRVKAVLSDFIRLRMPAPNQFYNDADQYFRDAASTTDLSVSNEARVFAAQTIGALAGMQQVGAYTEPFIARVVLEEALREYALRVPPAAQN